MYKLVRGDKDLRLVQDEVERFKPLLSPQDIARSVPHSIWRSCTPVEREHWEKFVRSGRVEPGTVSSPILESWNRCLEAEVEFAGGRCGDILSAKELERRQDKLLGAAEPFIETLYQYLRGLGFVIVLIDAEGYILKNVGDLEALRRAEKLNFGPGANWSELSVGTNAIGTALALGRPIQVTGPEHFNNGHHLWTCAAMPLRGQHGEIVGCLDISGPRENAKLKIMDMTVSAACLIEDRLHLETAHEAVRRANQLMSAALDSVGDGIISINAQGIIDGANASVSRYLGLDRRQLLGRRLDQAMPGKTSARLIGDDRRSSGEVLTLPGRGGGARCLVSAQPVPEEFGAGSVITFREIGRVALKWPKAETDHPVRYTFEDVIGRSPAILEAATKARMAARGGSTILILGESGTGKEIFAQAIHRESRRHGGPFVSINCGALPKELIQSELFGYTDGAFTGARKGGRRGKLELAHGGTLFLDEVADLPLDMQANLLRVLEEKAYLPVGGEKPVYVDVRFIAATNRRLEQEVAAGRFRQDLYYRLNVVQIHLPPLRQRGNDLRLLAEYHLGRLASSMDKTVARVDPALWPALAAHDWPGNIRELINVLEQAVNFMPGDELLPEHMPPALRAKTRPITFKPSDELVTLDALEKKAIEHALRYCRCNVSQVAKSLGIGRNTLYSKMKKYGIRLQEYKTDLPNAVSATHV